MKTPMTAEPFVPKTKSLETLRTAAQKCKGCPLYREATQTVFGEGPLKARIIMLGEQPGNAEDKAGRPFVGPAGHLLDKALQDAGLDRGHIYISNVVKHFKFKLKGEMRFHQRPSGAEIHACRPWLEAEMDILHPEVTVCLGASAAQGVLERAVTLRESRGVWKESPWGGKLLLTVHPSSILRIPDRDDRHVEYRHFVQDLKKVREWAPIHR